jgi:hypothetical protein
MSGYAIAHAVCVCATPARNRNHAEPASIGETIFIKMSPPFGIVGADYTNAKHIMAPGALQVLVPERRSADRRFLTCCDARFM